MKRKAKQTGKAAKRPIRRRHTGRVENCSGTYIARWMIDGKRYSHSTGIRERDFDTPEAAKAAADEWLQNHLRHVHAVDAVKDAGLKEATLRGAIATITAGAVAEIHHEAETADAGADLLIDTAFSTYVQSPRRRKVKDSTLRVYRSMFDGFKKWANKAHPEITLMKEITPYLAEEFARHIRQTIQGERYNSVLITLGHVWKVLEREIGAGANPWTGDNLPKQERAQSMRRPLTDEELRRVFAACAADRELTLLCAVMYLTGARLSDACLLRWDAVDFAHGIVRYTAVKTGATCKPPLQAQLRALLAETPEAERDGYVVPRFAEMYQSKDGSAKCSQAVIMLLKTAGIETSVTGAGTRRHPAVTAHSFRHTFVSRCGNLGIPLAIVQGWVGHMDEQMTRRYFHEDEAASVGWAAKLPLALADAQGTGAGRTADAEATLAPADGADATQGVLAAFGAILRRATDAELETMLDAIRRERKSRR